MVEIIAAKAIETTEYMPRRRWLSGFLDGFESKRVWKVQIQIGPTLFFTSNRKYLTRDHARRAALRLEGKS